MSMDRQEITLLVLLDLSAAFDTIDHQILLNVLGNDFGIIGSAHKWFASYLTGRKQRVLINGHTSDDFHLSCGVPQASCMGPILFNILYISRLYHVIANHLPSVHGYADDTQLYLSFKPNGRSSQDQAIASVEACKTFGDRAFARSGPFLCNKLPREIRNSQSVVIFKSKLKTYLFKLTYNLL